MTETEIREWWVEVGAPEVYLRVYRQYEESRHESRPKDIAGLAVMIATDVLRERFGPNDEQDLWD